MFMIIIIISNIIKNEYCLYNIKLLTVVNGNACYEIETTNESEECPAYWRKRKNDENI